MTVNSRSIVLALVLFLTAAEVEATDIAADAFNYVDGPLAGQNGGSGWITTWTGSGTNVSGGMAIGVNPSTIGFTQSRFFTNPEITSTLFVALDFVTPASIPLADSFVVVLRAGSNGSNLVIGKDVGRNVFSVGNSSLQYHSGVALTPNTSYHMVGVYDLVHQRVSLWIDPDSSDFYDVLDGSNSADASGLSQVGGHMYFVTFGGTLQFSRVDNIVISDSPADVGLQIPAHVPSLQVPALLGLTVLLMASSALVLHPRRSELRSR